MALTERVLFFRQLATSLRAGLPVEQALSLQVAQGPASLRHVGARAAQAVRRGTSLYESLKRTNVDRPVFLASDLAMVQVGERSGKLAECLDCLATQLEDSQRLWRAIAPKFAYPLFLVGSGMLAGPVVTLFVANSSAALILGLLKLGLIGGALGALYLGRDRPAVSRVLQEVFRRTPGLGGIAKKMQLYRMATILAFSYRAGIDLSAAFRLVSEAVSDPRLKQAMARSAVATERGQEASTVLGRSPELFTPTFLALFKTGEATGKLDEILLRQAEYWKDELATDSQLFARFVGLAAFLLSAASLLGPLLHMESDQMDQLSGLLRVGSP